MAQREWRVVVEWEPRLFLCSLGRARGGVDGRVCLLLLFFLSLDLSGDSCGQPL